MNNLPRVLLIDDDQHIRAYMKNLVDAIGFQVVADAADGAEGVALFENLNPNITLLDINMPKMNGDEALEKIMALNPNAFVIMLTSANNLEMVKKCLSMGATNYLLKNNPPDEICHAIKESWDNFTKE